MRAQITINLTWIFALIAGIVVFGMIIGFSNTQREESDLTTSFSVLEHIDTQIRTLAKTKNTFSEIETVKASLEIVCDLPDQSVLMLKNSQNAKPIRYQAIFSPEELTGNTFLAWTQEWMLPTSIDTFLYLSNKEVLFLIFNDSSGEYKKFLKEFPEKFPLVIFNTQNLTNFKKTGYDEYKFLLFGVEPQDIGTWNLNFDGDLSLVTFSSLKGYGGIKFYEFQNTWVETGKTAYAGDALMYGAAFSENSQHYNCSREKAFFRLKLLTEMNKERAINIMKELAGSDDECKAWIPNFVTSYAPSYYCNECLILMSELPNLYDELIDGMKKESLEDLYNASIEISNIGKDLAKGRNCPTL